MKKVVVLFAVITITSWDMNAQEIGVRFGGYGGGNVAIDGIFAAGQFSRIHADVSFYNGGVGIDALWDFVYKPLGQEAFNWYAGAGPYLGFGNSNFDLGVKGEIGLEYRFDFPMALGIDWRPGLEVVDNTQFHWEAFGLNVRYIIGE